MCFVCCVGVTRWSIGIESRQRDSLIRVQGAVDDLELLGIIDAVLDAMPLRVLLHFSFRRVWVVVGGGRKKVQGVERRAVRAGCKERESGAGNRKPAGACFGENNPCQWPPAGVFPLGSGADQKPLRLGNTPVERDSRRPQLPVAAGPTLMGRSFKHKFHLDEMQEVV